MIMTASLDEKALISAIARRAVRSMGVHLTPPMDTASLEMDITAVHLNDLPLDLPAMLDGNDWDFTHDIIEIQRNINRTTGCLQNFVVPRYAI